MLSSLAFSLGRFSDLWPTPYSPFECFISSHTLSGTMANQVIAKLGGKTAELYRKMVWDKTSLGAFEAWPEALKYLVNTMLACPIPMYLCWGPERIFLYNDAYRPLLGKKHPSALGERFEDVWPEIWPNLSPLFDSIGEGANYYAEDTLLVLERHGSSEDGFFTFSFNPIFDGEGKVRGLQCICYETKEKILNDRAKLNFQAQTEEAQIKAEIASAELERFFTQAPVAIIVLEGPNHHIRLSNKLYEQIAGRSGLIGKTVREAFPDLEGQPFFDILDQVYKTGVPYITTEAHVILKKEDGQQTDAYLDFTYAPRLSGSGTVEGISATVVDSTQKVLARQAVEKNAEDFKWVTEKLTAAQSALVDEKRKFEIIFEHATSAMAMVKEPKHVFEKANPSFRKMFCDRVVIGQSVENIFPEFTGKNFIDRLNHVYISGEAYHAREEKVVLKPGPNLLEDRRFLDISFIQLKSNSGKIEGVLIDLVDVTESIISRRKLEENEERLMLATKAAKIGIWDLNRKTDRVTLGDRASAIYQVKPNVQHSRIELFDRIHPEDREFVQQALQKACEPGGDGVYECMHRLLMPDGSTHWVSAFGQALGARASHEKATRVTGAILDITNNITIQQELSAAREAAENANSAKSAFLANMSHEIRSPLGAIMGFVELLKDPQIGREETSEYLGVIERNSHQLLRIIDDILDLSKVEAGKILIENIDFSLLEVLADFASLVGFKARENGIEFNLKATSALPDPVNSDPTRLRQILTNVVGNAIKFTKKGAVNLTVSYHQPMLRMVVRDSGVGISEVEVSRLFQPFGQADVSTTRKFGGTGLGLVLTKRLAQALGGDFWLESSEVGVGSTFVIEINVATPSHSKMIQGSRFTFSTLPVKNVLQDRTLLKGKRVLVVEDSPDNQMLLRVLLTRFGANVELAEDGLVGVEKALLGDFDIVLMDVQMPRMDGYEAVALLRSRGFEKPVVALTAHAMIEERQKCLEVGYSEFLSKPIDRSKLLDVLRAQLKLDE